MTLRVGQTLYAFSAVVGLALGVAGTIGAYQLNELRVGGPVYDRVVEGKDLVADILPPPAYVVEAYLDLTLNRYGSLSISKAEEELSRLKTEYDARIAHWQNSGLPEDMKSLLLGAADLPARKFWSIVETSYLPAIRNRDTVARDAAYAEIQRTFDEHRNGIATVVGSATELNASLEESARAQARSATLWQFGSIAFAMAILLLGILSLRRRVIAPLVKLTGAMRALANGRLDADAGAQTRASRTYPLQSAKSGSPVFSMVCYINDAVLVGRFRPL